MEDTDSDGESALSVSASPGEDTKLLKKSVTFDDQFQLSTEEMYQRGINNSAGACSPVHSFKGNVERRAHANDEILETDPRSAIISPALLSQVEMRDFAATVGQVAGKTFSRAGDTSIQHIVINNPQLNLTNTTQLSAPRARNISLGGTQNIESGRERGQQPDVDLKTNLETYSTGALPNSRAAHIQERTLTDINRWTHNMIKPQFVDKIVNMVDRGINWITITGNAGDGKTTTGYMVLKEMVQKQYKHLQGASRKVEVYHVKDTDQYQSVVDHMQEIKHDQNVDIVVMMNDVLGAFAFDPTALTKWEAIIHDALDNIAFKRDDITTNSFTVIFISRWNVLQSARNKLGKYEHDVFGSLVNMGDKHIFEDNERFRILDLHLKKMDICGVSLEEKETVISGVTPHGFPHCCKMFAALKKKKRDLNIVDFFACPLQFLDDTTKVLTEEKDNEELFKLMLKSDGKLDVYSIEDDELRQRMTSAALPLIGSYLTDNNGLIFSHPSIFESVANCVGRKDVVFALENFSLSVIMQKVRFQDTATHKPDGLSSTFISIPSSESVIERLCAKIVPLILKKDFSVLEHNFFFNKDFCEKIISSTTRSYRRKWLAPFWKNVNTIHIDKRTVNGDTLLHVAVQVGNAIAADVLLDNGATVDIPSFQNERRETPLQIACKQDNINMELLKSLIQHNSVLNVTDYHRKTPLHYLCQTPGLDEAIIDLMLKHKANTSLTDSLGRIPLHYLCLQKHLHSCVLRLMIQHGADVNKLDNFGRSPLQYVLMKERVDTSLLGFMIKHGADVNQSSQNEKIPLHYLCRSEHIDESNIHLMVHEGANVNKTSQDGSTPFHYLCRNVKTDTQILEFMIERGADINMSTRHGKTPLQYICQEGRSNRSNVELMIRYGADVTKADNEGMTPLNILCQKETTDETIIKCLVAKGAEVNKTDKNGCAPLHWLCQKEDIDTFLIDFFISHGGDVNKVNKAGYTPLHYLCQNNKSEAVVVSLLVAEVADVNKPDKLGCTPLHYLCRNERTDHKAIDMLIKHGANVDQADKLGCFPIHYLCRRNADVLSMKQILQNGWDVNKTSKCGMAALHFLCGNDKADKGTIKLLIKHGAEVNKTDLDGMTPLHYLCRHEEVDEQTINMMIKHGADVTKVDKDQYNPLQYLYQNQTANGCSLNLLVRHQKDLNKADMYGCTFLHYICKSGKANATALELIIEHGSDVNRCNHIGRTPLHILCGNEVADVSAFDMLIKHGADVNKADVDGWTPLHFLCLTENPDERSVRLLIQHGSDINKNSVIGMSPLQCLDEEHDFLTNENVS